MPKLFSDLVLVQDAWSQISASQRSLQHLLLWKGLGSRWVPGGWAVRNISAPKSWGWVLWSTAGVKLAGILSAHVQKDLCHVGFWSARACRMLKPLSGELQSLVLYGTEKKSPANLEPKSNPSYGWDSWMSDVCPSGGITQRAFLWSTLSLSHREYLPRYQRKKVWSPFKGK